MDISQGYLQIQELFSDEETELLEEILTLLHLNYKHIADVYQLLQSESMDTYPYVSFNFLKHFCKQNEIVDTSKMDKVFLKPKNPKEENKKSKSLNRSLFLRFLVSACKTNTEFGLSRFQDFLDNKIFPFFGLRNQMNIRDFILEDPEVHNILTLNKEKIIFYMESNAQFYGFNFNAAFYLMTEKAKLNVRKEHLFKFFSQAQRFLIDENGRDGKEFQTLNPQEFIEFVYRLSSHVYNIENYLIPIEQLPSYHAKKLQK